ncbi:hypothetical protein ACROYT_G013780 [Oculina patagonica]
MASEWLVSAKIGELLASERFDKDSIAHRELSLSQAFCLLWQNQQTGDVAGRQRPNAITDSATAAVLLDLYVLEKIDLEKEIKHWMDRKRQIVMVKVKDATLTGSYLDQALFSDIVKHHQRTDGKPRTIVEWIIQGSYERENSATVVLDSLVIRGILGRESKLFGRRYPTVDSEPQRKLLDEIRKVVLLSQPADGYIWTLLKLMYEADCCMGKKSPLLSRCFSPEEFLAAKETIKTLVTVNMQDEHATSTDTANAQSFELEIVG